MGRQQLHRDQQRDDDQRLDRAIDPTLSIPGRADDAEGRGHGQQPRTCERECDGFGDEQDRGDDERGESATSAVECNRDQTEGERESYLEVHRGNRRVLKRPTRSHLPADERNVSAKQPKSPKHRTDAEVLQDHEDGGQRTRSRNDTDQDAAAGRRDQAVHGNQINRESKRQPSDHVKGIHPVNR